MCRDFDDWLAYLAGVQRVSPQTVRSYRVAVGQYLAHLAGRGRRSPRRARRDDVEAFCAQLTGAPSTVAQRMYAVRSFHRWMLRAGRAKTNPAAGVTVPSVPELSVPAPTRSVVARVLAAHGPTARGVRDRAVVSVLYGCGLRVSELRSLRPADVDLEARRVSVLGKGRRRRVVPIPNGTIRDLQRWLALRDDASPYVFDGRGRDGMRSQEAIYAALKASARRAGVDAGVIRPHAMRHAFAVHLLAGGVDVRRIQRLLGHRSIATTCLYLAIEISDLTDAVDNHHPLADIIKPRAAAAAPWSSWLQIA